MISGKLVGLFCATPTLASDTDALQEADMAARCPYLFPCVMGRRHFRFGRFFRWFLIGLDPLGVEHARLVDAFVCMCAEEIALRLKKVCRKTSRAIAVEVSERRGKRWDSYAIFDRCRHRNPPVALRFPNNPRKVAIEQKIIQRGVALVRVDDPVQEFCANDATAAPDGGYVAEIQIPIVCRACRVKQLHSLRVGNDF